MNIEQNLQLLSKGTVEIIPKNGLAEKLETAAKEKRPLRIKLGADPSSPDIHLGHSVALKKLRQFQDAGHEVIFIIGDFTGMIGDPSGKTSTRKRLTKDEVLRNAETYKKQAFKILDPERTQVVFNSAWLTPMGFEDVLELTSHYTVARLLERDDFSKRFKSGGPISMLEFMYPLIQGYDSVSIRADIEIGGTDQTFNLLVGRDLQREYGQAAQVVMTLPLLEGLDGVNKMSKSLGNYIGIDEAPFDMFGKVMSISDKLMWRYYELLTDLLPDEIKAMQKSIEEGENPKNIKIKLAKMIVAQYYDQSEAEACEKQFEEVFSKKSAIPDDAPEVKVLNEVGLIEFMVNQELCTTKSEAKRLISQGAVTLDGEKFDSFEAVLKPGTGVLKVGKRKFVKLI